MDVPSDDSSHFLLKLAIKVIQIKSDILAEVAKPTETKLGLSMEERMRIFDLTVRIENRADDESLWIYPIRAGYPPEQGDR